MILGVARDCSASPVGLDELALGNGLDGVVSALAVDIRSKRFEQGHNSRFRKDHDKIDRAESGQELRAVLGGKNRPALPLHPSHAGIVIDSHDEHVGLPRCAFQVADVPDVQEVETATGERDRTSGPTQVGGASNQLVSRNDFAHV